MPPLTLTELQDRVDDFAAFSSPEVTETIERLQRPDVVRLADMNPFMDKVERHVRNLQKQLQEKFVDRDELIEMALACFIAHLPMIALGPPGTAKSQVFRQLAWGLGLQQKALGTQALQTEMQELIDQLEDGSGGKRLKAQPERQYFEYLVTRYTTPDEILGPPHLDLMLKMALFYRQTIGLLPESQVAFLDELFKANSAILNALLSILNERLFYNAGRASRVPLCMVFAASNEPPAEEELWALYDRFPVRVLCSPVEDTVERLGDLLDTSMTEYVHGLMGDRDSTPIEQLATVNHFRLLHRTIHLSAAAWEGREKDNFRRAYIETFKTLRREFQISDRSMFLFYRLCHALAVLRGNHRYPRMSELEVFKYCFRDPEAAPALRDVVQERMRRY